ncbi:MAG: arsenite methyltransferase [Phycisphaerae bacterium]|jgi:SAM-dependent methyltransferase
MTTAPARPCCAASAASPDPAPPLASCCSASAAPAPGAPADAESLRERVREGYARIAREAGGAARSGCCGGPSFTPETLATAIGYTAEELATLPDTANMGLACGNPAAIAALRPGEVVLDLGAGGGFDCFLAGPKVGPAGRVIGVDMTPDMLARARRGVAAYRQRSGLDNVEFRLGEIEHLPVADASVDVVISNCVLNLSPDKPQVWREIARVLRPGGRVAVSDLALLRPLPEAVRRDVEALVGCVAGAVLVDDTRAMALAAGLTDVVIAPKPGYVEALEGWQDPLYQRIVAALPSGARPADFITSVDVSARKPGAPNEV